jgi:hypothetical protein
MTSFDKAKPFFENEFKLESKTNLQLKYNAIEQSRPPRKIPTTIALG